MENINYFDVIVLALVFMLGLKGLLRGFIKESFALIGIVVGVYIASRNALDVGNLISNNIFPIDNENVLLLAGFIITLTVVWIVAYVIGTLISGMFTLSGLGVFDKILGFIFGAGKIFFIFSIIVYALGKIAFVSDKLNETTKNSIIYPILKQTGEFIIKLDPTKIKEDLNKQIDTVSTSIQDSVEKVK